MKRSEILEVAKPIVFNTDMVVAILFGSKKETRRIIKYIGINRKYYYMPSDAVYGGIHDWTLQNPNPPYHRWLGEREYNARPPFKVGDYIWVRETWCNVNKPEFKPDYYYFADARFAEDYISSEWTWRPSIHMPKEAARIFLKVIDVKVEKLQDITEDGARSEGSDFYKVKKSDKVKYFATSRERFIALWNSTVKKKDSSRYGWEANPWVWVIKFERVECDE